MIGSTRSVRVYAYGAPVDMRKGFDGLASLARNGLGKEPTSGDMFLFVSRDRVRAKVLLWDGTGLCLYSKRLERGRFAALWGHGRGDDLELTQSELQLFLEGNKEVAKKPLSPPEIDPEASLHYPADMIKSDYDGRKVRAGHRETQGGVPAH